MKQQAAYKCPICGAPSDDADAALAHTAACKINAGAGLVYAQAMNNILAQAKAAGYIVAAGDLKLDYIRYIGDGVIGFFLKEPKK